MEQSRVMPRQFPVIKTIRRVLSIPELGVIFALVALLIVFSLENRTMLSRNNITTMIQTMSFTGIIVVGMTFLMIAGEIDLSVGGVYALASAIVGYLTVTVGWSVGATVVAVVLAGIAVGLFNGVVTVKLELPAFVVTLGTMFAARSLGDVLTNGNYIWGLPEDFVAFGRAAPLGFSWSFWTLIVLVILGEFMLRWTIFGSMVKATGGNKQAARIAGIRTDWVKIACFVLTSELAMISGLLATAVIATGDSHIGPGMELDVIASSVIGGTSLLGGVGSVIGTLLGTSVLQVIRSGLIMAGINIDWQNIAVGSALAGAASIDLLRRRAKKY